MVIRIKHFSFWLREIIIYYNRGVYIILLNAVWVVDSLLLVRKKSITVDIVIYVVYIIFCYVFVSAVVVRDIVIIVVLLVWGNVLELACV